MCKETRITSALLILIAAGIVSGNAYAKPDMAKKEKAACALCHVNPAGGKDLSDVGKIYQEKKEVPTDAAQVPVDKQAKYIGDNDCAACHTAEFSSWEKTKHAAAFKPLVEKKAEKNAGCLTCHTTGNGLPGGYEDGVDALKNVTCEACHGPGGSYLDSHAKKGTDRAKLEAAGFRVFRNLEQRDRFCRQCHNELMGMRFPGCRDDFFPACTGLAVADILQHAPGK